MYVIDFHIQGTWREVADAARTTIGMEAGTKEPSNAWKYKMLQAEHSPIRLLTAKWKWVDLKSWVSVHFVRHKIGIEHFVRTQRSDRTGVDRNNLPQSALVEHACSATVQSLITISRKRLCKQASKETQEAWQEVLVKLHEVDPVIYDACVPECVYRGFCPELKCCGFNKTLVYNNWRNIYKEIGCRTS